jgi:predicted metal-dependent RNase
MLQVAGTVGRKLMMGAKQVQLDAKTKLDVRCKVRVELKQCWELCGIMRLLQVPY